MGRTYVMSDIHGEYEKFRTLLREINFTNEDRLIIAGDVVDRGDNPIGIVKYIMEHKNIELIRGNHEEMLLDYLDTSRRSEYDASIVKMMWERNGGFTTLFQFESLSLLEQRQIEKFLRNTPLYKIVGNFIICHSGLVCYERKENETIEEYLNSQFADNFLWSREEFYQYPAIPGYTVIFGHTVVKCMYQKCDGVDIPLNRLKIWKDTKHNDKIGIDCGAVFGGKLACLCLDTMEEFYV